MSDQKKKAARKHRRFAREKDGAPNLGSMMKCALCALPVTAIVGLLLLFATTALLLMTKDPNRYHTVVGFISIYVTAFLGGMIATRLYGRRSPLFCGLTEALLLILLTGVVALFLPDALKNDLSGGIAVLTRVLLLPASLCGALLASRQKQSRKRRHR